MQALSDEQRPERLEKKVDEGFAEMRAEFREVRREIRDECQSVREELRTEILANRSELSADVRMLVALVLGMFATVIFGLAGLFATQI
jgi:hypothetical protein